MDHRPSFYSLYTLVDDKEKKNNQKHSPSLPEDRRRSLLGFYEAVGLLSVLVDQRDRRRQVGLIGLDVSEAQLEQASRSREEDRKPDDESVIREGGLHGQGAGGTGAAARRQNNLINLFFCKI